MGLLIVIATLLFGAAVGGAAFGGLGAAIGFVSVLGGWVLLLILNGLCGWSD